MLQDLLSPAMEDVSWRYISECLVIAAKVVVVDEASDGPFQLAGEFVGDLVNFPLNRPLVALQLTVSLGMKGCCQYVTDTHQMQIVPKGSGDVTGTVVREQFGAVPRQVPQSCPWHR